MQPVESINTDSKYQQNHFIPEACPVWHTSLLNQGGIVYRLCSCNALESTGAEISDIQLQARNCMQRRTKTEFVIPVLQFYSQDRGGSSSEMPTSQVLQVCKDQMITFLAETD